MASQDTCDGLAATAQGNESSRQIQQPEHVQSGQIDDHDSHISIDPNDMNDGVRGGGRRGMEMEVEGRDDDDSDSIDRERVKACIDFTLWQHSEGRCMSEHFQDRVAYNLANHRWHMRRKKGYKGFGFGRLTKEKSHHKDCSSCIASYANSGVLWEEFVQAVGDWRNRQKILETYISVGTQPCRPLDHDDGQKQQHTLVERAEEALDVCSRSLESYESCREPLRDVLDTLKKKLSPKAIEMAEGMMEQMRTL